VPTISHPRLTRSLRLCCNLTETDAEACITLHREARRRGAPFAVGGPRAVGYLGGPTQAIHHVLAAHEASIRYRALRKSLGTLRLTHVAGGAVA
jgi:hypothetical protein